MRIWVDDVREAPEGYNYWCKTTDITIAIIEKCLEQGREIKLLDLDHDSGDFFEFGGDYIRILDWLEQQKVSIPIRIHSMNPIGRQNMERIIFRNNWELVR